MTLKEQFTRIYQTDHWRGPESRSGIGSGLDQTAAIRHALPTLIQELGIQTVLDAGCGDYHWMRETVLGADYLGVDIVEDLLAANLSHERAGVSFRCADIACDPLPCADLILCRDVLVHLTYDQIREVVRNFITSGSRYLLTTTFTQHCNQDLTTLWRPLNLELPPFKFPRPLQLIAEGCSGEFDDNHLGLWRLQ